MHIALKLIIATLSGVALGGSAIQALNAQAKPPAYVITEIDVTDAEAFREYAPKVQPSFAPFGGRYMVRGGNTKSLVGEAPKRVVVLAFDSMEKIQAWYDSPEYEALKSIRDRSGKPRIFAAEGIAP